MYDLIGAYYLRDVIEAERDALGKPGDEFALPTMAAADALLKSFCRDDNRHEMERLEPEDFGTWW